MYIKTQELLLLLHHDILVNDIVRHYECFQVEKIDVPALRSKKKMFAARFETHRRDFLQFALQR